MNVANSAQKSKFFPRQGSTTCEPSTYSSVRILFPSLDASSSPLDRILNKCREAAGERESERREKERSSPSMKKMRLSP